MSINNMRRFANVGEVISIRRRWKRLAEEILLMLILIMSNNFIFLPATADPINNGPVFSSPFPLNSSVGVSVNLSSVNVTICDPEGDRFDWSIETCPDVGSKSKNNARNGSKSCKVSSLNYSTTYIWFVNASDDESWTREYFMFTTEDAPLNDAPMLSNPYPLNGSSGVLINTSSLYISIEDPNGDSFNWTIETYPDVGSNFSNSDLNGSKSCILNNLSYSTTYIWFVNVTDNEIWTRLYFVFITEDAPPPNNAPVFSSPSINNNSTDISVSISSINIIIEDTNGDSFNWTIETYPDVGSNFSNTTENGSKICMLSGLAYSTTYVWFVNATDGEDWTREYFLFTTEDAPIENPSKGGGSGGGGQPQNNPPETPTKPSGPTFIEMGVEYLFSSISTDMNGDLIRYQFDWGDGTKSEWSEFIPSNTQVSMSHFWNSIATYEVKILAQDDNGRYSGWSEPLEVVVSQVEEGNIPSVAVINFSRDDINDHTIKFDAYDSLTPHGNITDYLWDFGDGEHGNGIQIVHTYKKPGTYNVTLVIKDNKSNPLCNSSIHIAVRSQVEKQSEIKQAIYFFIFVIGVVVLGLFIVFSETFKNDVSYFFSRPQFNSFSLF